MAIEPRHITDEELRERLRAGMPSLPPRGLPGISAPAAAPRIMAPAAPVAPGAPGAPAPHAAAAARQPAARPSRLPVSPEVADYAKRMVGEQPDRAAQTGEVYQPSKSWAALVAGIVDGRSGKPWNYGQFAAMDRAEQAKADKAKANAETERQRALAAEEGDPASARSKARQQAMTPMLLQLGLSPEEIGTLSAADIKGMAQGGNLATTVAEARAKARAALEKAEADKAALGEKRTYDETQEAKRDERDFEQSQVLAAIQANVQAGRMVDSAMLNDLYAQAREARSKQATIDEEQRKKQARLDEAKSFRIPGIEVVDEGRFTRTAMDDTQRRKLEDSASAYATIRDGAQRMRELREKHGVTITDQKAITDYNTARNMAISGLSTLANTGVINPGEFERYKADIPDITPTATDALALVPGVGDPKAARLEGFEASILDTIDARLATSGARLSRGGTTTQPATDKPKDAPTPAAAPLAEPATPGWEQPKTFPPVPDGMVRIQLPDGSTKVGPKTAVEQALKLYPGAKVVE